MNSYLFMEYIFLIALFWVNLTTIASFSSISNSTCAMRSKSFKIVAHMQDQIYSDVRNVHVTNVRPQIHLYDVFAFTNEIDTLIIRLHELASLATKFIIVEATETFSGLPRNLTYPTIANEKKIKKYENKIQFVVCEYPSDLSLKNSSLKKEDTIWKREHYLRDTCMMNGLRGANVEEKDMIIVGDIDEIPSAVAIATMLICDTFNGKRFDHEIGRLIQTDGNIPKNPQPSVVVFITYRLHFNFHCRSSNMGNWKGPCVVFGSALNTMSISAIRDARAKKYHTLFYVKGGWHLSNFYYHNIQMLVDKYQGFSHQEITKTIPNTVEYWSEVIKKGGNTHTNTHCDEVEFLELPKYIYKNIPYFKYLLNDNQVMYGESLINKFKNYTLKAARY